MKVTIVVRLKGEVTDVSGRTIADSLSKAGFSDVQGVRTGKVYEIDINTTDVNEAQTRVEEIAKKLLSSETTEEFLVVDVSAS